MSNDDNLFDDLFRAASGEADAASSSSEFGVE